MTIATSILPLKMETTRKTYKKVELKLDLFKSFLIRFDDRKWTGVPKNKGEEKLNCEWIATLPDGKTKESVYDLSWWWARILRQCLQYSEVFIDELHIQDAFFEQEELRKVRVGKVLRISSVFVFCEDNFLSMFENSGMAFLDIQVDRTRVHCLDTIRKMPVEKLYLTVGKMSNREELATGEFRAKKWVVGESKQDTPPLLRQFVQKILREDSPIGCTYYATHDSPIDPHQLMAEMDPHLPVKSADLSHGRLLSIKFGDRKEVNISQVPPKRLGHNFWTYTVKVDYSGIGKGRREKMGIRERLAERTEELAVFLVPKLAPIPIFRFKPLARLVDFLLSIPDVADRPRKC